MLLKCGQARRFWPKVFTMEPLHILLNWDRIHPHLHAQIQAVDPRVRLHWGAPLASDDPEFLRMLSEAEILFGVYRPRGMENQASRLKWIQNIGAGVEWYWHSEVPRTSIRVTTASGVGGHGIAEYVVMAVMMLLKRVPERMEAQRAHRWQRVRVSELRGKTLLVIGLGGIGMAVARLAKAFDTHVLATRRNLDVPKPEYVDEVFSPAALDELLPRADIVAICAAFTPETEHLIGESELALMKPSALLVNVARGSLLDERAVARSLTEGRLSGAVLDVFDPEPLTSDSPLWDLPNVLISAHNTVANDVYDQNLVTFFCEQLQRYLQGAPLLNLVDPVRGY